MPGRSRKKNESHNSLNSSSEKSLQDGSSSDNSFQRTEPSRERSLSAHRRRDLHPTPPLYRQGSDGQDVDESTGSETEDQSSVTEDEESAGDAPQSESKQKKKAATPPVNKSPRQQKQNDQKKKHGKQEEKTSAYKTSDILVVVTSISAIFILLTAIIYTSNEEQLPISCEKLENPANEIQELSKELLPYQAEHFWRTIKSGIRSTTKYKRPACIVITPDELDSKAKDVILSLSMVIECALSGVNKSLAIAGEEYAGTGKHSELDRKLESWFNEGHKTVVMYDIDKLHIDTAKVFYKFCDDNDDPLYPETLLLLTTTHRLDESPLASNWLDLRLRNSWSKDDDVITPILSRVANSWTRINNTCQSERVEL